MKKYNIIYADPPWEYKESGAGHRGTAGLPYSTMSTEEICKLPIKDLQAEKSILFIWATFRKLEECLKVIDAWGFEYYGLGFDWCKLSKNGKPAWGMGYYTRQNNEVCLIGVPHKKENRLKPVNRDVLCSILAEREEHSKKPDIIKDLIVRAVGDLPRIELFARQKTESWDIWGNEVKNDVEIEVKNER